MSSPPRIACLAVPLFPLAARLRSEPELAQEAVAILEGNGERARVVAATRLARRAGITAGLTLPQARARLPRLVARGRDASCEQAAQEALLEVAESISPRVEDAGEGRVYLDLTGLEGHYPGDDPELELGRAVIREVEQRAGLPVRVGIASSKLAARLAAARPHSPTRVAAGEEAAFLAPLELSQLTGESQVLAILERWGVRSVGDFARLPADEVASRLGQAGRRLHAIACGRDPQPLMPRQPPPTFREGMELEWPLTNLEPFVFVARAALQRLVARLAGCGLGCARLELSLALEPDGHDERTLTLPAPTREVKTLLTLLSLDLERRPPGAALRAFTLTAHPDRPRHAQLTLFGPTALAPDKLATTLARLFTLLGEGRIGAPRTVDGHRPERFALEPYAPPPPPAEHRPPPPGRGLLSVRVLRPPIPLEVITDAPPPEPAAADQVAEPAAPYDAPPARARPRQVKSLAGDGSARRPRIAGAVRVASGPWTLEEGWWTKEPLAREYWDVELQGGVLYRIFRDRASGDWFADGVYD
ncbi:MAG: DNA polymerase Y family protein [Acidobacteria bacterium]|nr:MAG: DNA polymerase Y family protein [Acidobacteriota bacterium]